MKNSILIVDDDEVVRLLLREYLSEVDAEIHEAENGATARNAVVVRPPNLVVCDIMMPVMDGIEFLSWIKGNPATSAIPVMMITADEQPETRSRAMAEGADDYLLKPFEFDRFAARVNRFLV